MLPDLPFNSIDKFAEISELELKEIILAGNTKSSSSDPVPTKLSVKWLDCMLPTLIKIINLSIS